jgi:transposase
MLVGMRTYSLDLRERALAAVDRGMPRKEALGVFGVSLATLKRWLKRREQTGSAAPKRRPGMRRRVGATSEERRALWRQLEEDPEATLEEHRALWERGRGVRVSVATMSRAIRRLGWTYKQRLWRPPSGTSERAATGASG